MMKNVAFGLIVALGLGVSSLPAYAVTSDQFIAAANVRIDEINTEISDLRLLQPRTPAIRRQIRALAGTANQLRSLSLIAPSRPEQVLINFANYYQLAISSS